MTASAPNAPVSTECAACGQKLHDLVDAQTGLDLSCRGMYSYRHISSLSDQHRIEANELLHAVANNKLRGAELRAAIFRIYELGFVELSKRIERRVGRQTIDVMPEPAPAPPPPSKPALVLPFALTQGQEKALDAVRTLMTWGAHGVAIVVGFAGTGKTTLVKIIAHEHGTPLVVCPTGKAALRVREATGVQARTIHSWLYHALPDEKTGSIRFVRRGSDDLEIPQSRLVVLDESSMVGPDVWKDVYGTCEQHDLRLVCIGDGFQLPPVQPRDAPPFSILAPGFGEELGAIRIEMTEVLRQAQESPVIRASMALRNGAGVSALRELPHADLGNFGQVALATYKEGGVIICHRNATRLQLNAMFRQSLGIHTEIPQVGEPLLCLKNAYEVGLVNGESFNFPGWEKEPTQPETVRDKWKGGIEENVRYGGIEIPNAKGAHATIALEELHGRLSIGMIPIEIGAGRWARMENFFSGDKLASHVHAAFGYTYTAHKCVHPDTLVETRYGLQQINSISAEGEIATALGKRSYRSLVKNPPGKMLRVTTKDGYTVDVTPDHGLFVWNGTDYVRVEAQHILPGAFVRLGLLQQFVTPFKAPRLPPAPETDVRATRYNFPAVLTEDVAELLGLLVADGTVTERGTIRLAKRHEDVVARFAELCKRVFDLPTQTTPKYNGTRAFCAEAHSKQVADWLRVIGGTEPNNKFVPPVILQAPLNQQARFLRGLFEDGTVNVKRGIVDHIEWSNRSDAVVATVQTMLLRFGIISGRRSRTTRQHPQTMLYVYGQNAKRFGGAIGFVSQFKNERVRLPTGRETRYVVPFSSNERDAVWAALREDEKNNLRSRGTLSRDRTAIVLEREPARAVRELLEEKLGWHHTRVATITQVEDAPSMCVEVPDGGRFLQNGFDGSNSQGSEWPWVLVVVEPSVRLDEEEGRRWLYTAATRAKKMTAVFLGKI